MLLAVSTIITSETKATDPFGILMKLLFFSPEDRYKFSR